MGRKKKAESSPAKSKQEPKPRPMPRSRNLILLHHLGQDVRRALESAVVLATASSRIESDWYGSGLLETLQELSSDLEDSLFDEIFGVPDNRCDSYPAYPVVREYREDGFRYQIVQTNGEFLPGGDDPDTWKPLVVPIVPVFPIYRPPMDDDHPPAALTPPSPEGATTSELKTITALHRAATTQNEDGTTNPAVLPMLKALTLIVDLIGQRNRGGVIED